MKLHEAPDDVLIAAYVQRRDRRAQRKKAYLADDEKDVKQMGNIENELLRRLNERGTDSTSARGIGLAYRNIKTSASVADRAAFLAFVQKNNAWDFVTNAISKEAVDGYVAEHNDLPPGVNYTQIVTVGFRRG